MSFLLAEFQRIFAQQGVFIAKVSKRAYSKALG